VKLRVIAAAGLLSLVPVAAGAQTVEPDHPKKLEFTGKRFNTGEYIATGTMLAGLGAATLLMEDGAPRWRGGVLVDQQASALGRAETPEGRREAARASDYLLYGMMAWPYLDAGVAMARGSNDAAWQMALINTEAQAFTGLMTFVIKRTVLRERPYVAQACEGSSDPKCGSSASFLSGHSSHAFTGAGLVCAHHGAMPLYGNKIADVSACVTALAAATVTGSLRVVADVHYASDVFAGATLGLFSGWLLPKILHYGGFSSSPNAVDTAKKNHRPIVAWSATPMATPGGAMVMVSGVTF
jgi:hypothetical protein